MKYSIDFKNDNGELLTNIACDSLEEVQSICNAEVNICSLQDNKVRDLNLSELEHKHLNKIFNGELSLLNDFLGLSDPRRSK